MTKQIDYEDEFERFKKSRMQIYNLESLDKFEYSEQHHRYAILPKGFDYSEDNLSEYLEITRDRDFFDVLNFGWDMWVGCLLEERRGVE